MTRKISLLVAAMASALVLASGVAWAASDTFSNTTRITIPDRGAATPYPSAISVSGLGTVTDVNLKLNGFGHEYPGDVRVELVGPRGAPVVAMSRAGGSSEVSGIDLTLDDEAASALPSGQLSSGTFRPSSSLSAFDGTNPNGAWELFVDDLSGGDSGSISGGWSLTITSEGAVEPPPSDETPPDTTLTETPPAFSSVVNPTFAFRSSETGSRFECKIDSGAYQACTSPKRYPLLSEGRHTFSVRATDAADNTDPSPAEHTWTLDSLDPDVRFTQKPGTYNRWTGYWVTDVRSPSWSWTVQDPNLDPDTVECELYDDLNDRYILEDEPCSSQYAFEGSLPDGDYSFEVEAYDEAGNYGYAYQSFEVDTVAPEVVSTKPTGNRVGRYADVLVTFDDELVRSGAFVNIYRRGTNAPLAVYRYAYDDEEIEIAPKNALRPGTWYTVKVTTGVNDGANNLAAAKTWSFKTKGKAPRR